MSEAGHPTAGAKASYRIGAVARITGVSTHTLRKWEDRHALVAPRRSEGGERLYTSQDVHRITVARDLARAGVPLGDIAELATDALERMLEETRQAASETTAVGSLRAAVVGDVLGSQIQRDVSSLRHLRVSVTASDISTLVEALDGTVPDILVVECPTVLPETAATLDATMQATGAAAAIVVYGYGVQNDVNALRRNDIALLRAPADATEIERVALGMSVSLWERPPAAAPSASEVSTRPRRYSREQLARYAAMSTDIECECPHHLAELVAGLGAFEDYSAACESRDPRDAALHRYLHDTAGASRALLEDALAELIAQDGLDED